MPRLPDSEYHKIKLIYDKITNHKKGLDPFPTHKIQNMPRLEKPHLKTGGFQIENAIASGIEGLHGIHTGLCNLDCWP